MAFNKVWREDLLYKLISMGISGKCYRLVKIHHLNR